MIGMKIFADVYDCLHAANKSRHVGNRDQMLTHPNETDYSAVSLLTNLSPAFLTPSFSLILAARPAKLRR